MSIPVGLEASDMEYLNQGRDKSLTELARTGHGSKVEDKIWLQIRVCSDSFRGFFFSGRVKYPVSFTVDWKMYENRKKGHWRPPNELKGSFKIAY